MIVEKIDEKVKRNPFLSACLFNKATIDGFRQSNGSVHIFTNPPNFLNCNRCIIRVKRENVKRIKNYGTEQ